jgi:hypothetical protein
VRLFLDAHISGPRIARALRGAGHDVWAADEERELDGLTDEDLLSIATVQELIFVTFDVKDFPVIARRWAEAGRVHAGCAVVVGIDHGEFGAILDTIARGLTARPGQADWTDLTLFLARTPPGLGFDSRRLDPRGGRRLRTPGSWRDPCADGSRHRLDQPVGGRAAGIRWIQG